MIFSPDTIIVTGGCGFIGSNFIRHVLSFSKPPKIINIDSLTYAGNLYNLKDYFNSSNYKFIKGDIRDYNLITRIIKDYNPEAIVNFAAESHVDRSIKDPQIFVKSNIEGTLSLLRASTESGIRRFLQVSTDEVYGSLGNDGYFTEDSGIYPNSPYSASKASADNFVRAYHHTYKLNTLITRCSNNYGPYQFPEKLIPLIINNALNDKKIPIYGNGLNIRDWLHVLDHCTAIWTVLENGNPGEVYNIGGDSEKSNIEIVKTILKQMNKPDSLIKYVKDRPGHDFRYAIDSSKINKELNWTPSISFTEGIKDTIEWYMINKDWLNSIFSKEYKDYYKQYYGDI